MPCGHGHNNTLPRADFAKWPTFSTTLKLNGVIKSSDWQLEETAAVAVVAQVEEVATEVEAATAKTAEEKATFVVQEEVCHSAPLTMTAPL